MIRGGDPMSKGNHGWQSGDGGELVRGMVALGGTGGGIWDETHVLSLAVFL